MYTAVRYDTQEDAVAAFKKMIQRKREWIKNTEKELEQLRKDE